MKEHQIEEPGKIHRHNTEGRTDGRTDRRRGDYILALREA